MEKTIHHGRNIRRFREMLSLKQDALAHELGTDWNQKKVSLLEAKEHVEEKLLAEVAAVLKVPVEAIKNFDEEQAIYNIQNNYDNASHNVNYQFNAVEKIIALYDELLRVEREKYGLLEKLAQV